MLVSTSTVFNLVDPQGVDRDDLAAHCDQVMEALLTIEAEGVVHSAAVSLDTACWRMEIDLCAEATDVDQGRVAVDEAIHRAIEKAGAYVTGAQVLGKTAELVPAS